MLRFIFFFKQKTAYEIKECDWSSDVCSSDLFGSISRRQSPSLARNRRRWMKSCRLCLFVLWISMASIAQVAVRHQEGLVHGFLALRTLEGETLADGDLMQTARSGRVTSRLVFHFKDGSLHDETAVFSQRGHFRLISDHLIQKGPAFKHPIDMTVNGKSGNVSVRYTEDGKEKTADDHFDLTNAGNGLQLTLLKNILPDTPETKVAFVVATPKPQLVTLVIKPQAEEPFSTGDARRKAVHFVVKVDIGGISGVLADLLGKQPPDTNVWILEGEAPAFVKSEE